MIENVTNIIQMIAIGLCAAISLWNAHLSHKRTWVLMGLTALVFFYGDLYWQFFLAFFGHTPEYSHISYYSWYAGYVFLLLLIQAIRDDRPKCKSRLVFLVPLFTIGMCLLYMQWGDYVSNIISCALMTCLMLNAIDGLLYIYSKKYVARWAEEGIYDAVNAPAQGERSAGMFYAVVLLACLAEYGAWTSSVFFWENYDTFANPYYWFDMLVAVSFLLFPTALRKAVGI